jgi:hypothetical protein
MKNFPGILTLSALTLLIGLSNIICAQENYDNKQKPASLYTPCEVKQPVLFRFLQDRMFLELMEQHLSQQNTLCPLCFRNHLAELQFNSLYSQIILHLNELKKNEENDHLLLEILKNWATPEKNDLHSLIELYDEITTIGNFPNHLDLISIELLSKFALSKALESSQSNEASNTMKNIFKNKLLEYQVFIHENSHTLKVIKKIADNGFKILKNTDTSDNQSIEIKSLSEILDYIKILQKNEDDIKNLLLYYYILPGVHQYL